MPVRDELLYCSASVSGPAGLPRPSGCPAGGAHAFGCSLTHGEMNAAIEAGTATSPLFRQNVLRFDGSWWELSRGGAVWIAITDALAIAFYDGDAAAMTPGRAEARRAANIRAAAR